MKVSKGLLRKKTVINLLTRLAQTLNFKKYLWEYSFTQNKINSKK